MPGGVGGRRKQFRLLPDISLVAQGYPQGVSLPKAHFVGAPLAGAHFWDVTFIIAPTRKLRCPSPQYSEVPPYAEGSVKAPCY